MRLIAAMGMLVSVPCAGLAQDGTRSTLGPSFTLLVKGGNGVHSSSCETTFFGALGLNAARPAARQSVRLQVAGRAYVLAAGGALCALAPFPPPADGTYTQEDASHLTAHGFVTTDARLDIDLPARIATVSGGGGVAWRQGRDVPYVIAGVGFPVVDGVRHRFGVQVDYQWLRITNDRFLRTFQSGVMTAEQRLGTVAHWSNSVTVGVRWAFGL